MKISISSFCWKCFDETSKTKEDYERLRRELYSDIDKEVELNEENLYEIECPKGHKTYTSLQAQKFELLFDLASMALLDGYTREAVSGISCAFERFIEYYILILSLKNSVPLDEFLEKWKQITNQSERQLGAFIAFRIIERKEFNYNKKFAELRNKVIHKGYIPETQEVVEYGDFVLQNIYSILKELKLDCLKYIQEATFIHLKRSGEKIIGNVNRSTSAIPTIINLVSISSDDFGVKTFSEALISMKGNYFYKRFYKKDKFNHIL